MSIFVEVQNTPPDPGNLIVEDGTGKADANAYISLTDAAQYLTDLGYTAFAALTTAAQEAAIRRATAYMVQVYRMRWKGYRRFSAQALDWPRQDVSRPDGPGLYGTVASVYPDDEVPDEVRQACALLALKASTTELAPDLGRSVKREKIGALEVEYMPGALPYTVFRDVDNLLGPLLKAGGGAARLLVRA